VDDINSIGGDDDYHSSHTEVALATQCLACAYPGAYNAWQWLALIQQVAVVDVIAHH